MISVVIPALNAEAALARTLAALVPAAVEGLIKEVIIVDGGSTDGTAMVADEAGARLVRARRGRGSQLAAGAEAARGEWLLFLHADTIIEPGFEAEVFEYCGRTNPAETEAAVFRLQLDDNGPMARMLEAVVRLRTCAFGLPYGDQGLLIGAAAYQRLGGYRPLPLMEDVDLVRRLGRRRLTRLRSKARTSAERYRRDGYVRRMARNSVCLALYFAGVAPQRIARLYG
jgi:rSAM/selenodomain-associated transferase 2